jgi:DNA-directed RNA polymerase subunit F
LAVYQKFQEELFPLTQRTVELVLAYASVFQRLTDDQAAKIVDEYLTIQDSRQKTMKKYFKQFMKILPSKKVFRYLQIENKLAAVGCYELAEQIPLER